jgi:hypothetical protein
MSKRLQVLLQDEEYQELAQVCRKQAISIAQWVRGALRKSLQQSRPLSPEKKLARILKFTKHEGPTGDINEILSDIERGRNQ